ncbi:MAG: NAD(P)-dependent oxidoreductase [Steroidobacteraceae bacterium]
MRALIVGSTSSLAKVLKPALMQLGEVLLAGRRHADIALDLNASAEEMALPADLDAIVHAAAHFGGKTDEDIRQAQSVNVLGTLKLCQAAVRARARHLVLISSIYADAGASSGHAAPSGNDNIYALSKRHADELAQFYCAAHGLPLCILRPTQLYGDGDEFRRHQPFFYHLADQAQAAREVTLYGTHDARRNYLHAEDLAHIISLTIQQRITGVYACGHPHDVTYSQVAEAAFAAFATEKRIRFLADKADIPDHIYPVNDALYRLIGFTPRISIEAGLKRIALFRASRP